MRACANSGSSCGLSPAWPGVRTIEIGGPEPSTPGGRPHTGSPPILRWSAKVALPLTSTGTTLQGTCRGR
jgi:hypothetical protein